MAHRLLQFLGQAGALVAQRLHLYLKGFASLLRLANNCRSGQARPRFFLESSLELIDRFPQLLELRRRHSGKAVGGFGGPGHSG